MKKTVKGEMTVYLSLVFLLLLSLTGTVLESASIQTLKNEKYTRAVCAIESVFAEYQKELLEKYHIFAVDSSYGSDNPSEDHILNRLSFYGAENMDAEISRIRYLTDDHGQPFYEQAVAYEKIKKGAAVLEGMDGRISVWEETEDDSSIYREEDAETSRELSGLLEDAQENLPQDDNPIQVIEDIKRGNLLSWVLPEAFPLSDRAVNTSTLVSHRQRTAGYGAFHKQQDDLSTVFFNLYLTDHLPNALDGSERSGLLYGQEYVLAGKESDAENLKAVIQKLLWMRVAPAYAYLLTDYEKQTEAEAMAASLCLLLTVPQITEIVKHAILLSWAYGEALVDVKTLLEGKKVAFVKTGETWNLELSALLSLGAGGGLPSGQDVEGGTGYKEYLQMLLVLKGRETLSMRTLDYIEQEFRSTEELGFFRADACVTAIEVKTRCMLRRGITYEFPIRYSYK